MCHSFQCDIVIFEIPPLTSTPSSGSTRQRAARSVCAVSGETRDSLESLGDFYLLCACWAEAAEVSLTETTGLVSPTKKAATIRRE